MRVLIVEPGQYPREADIDGSLDTLQHIVGGLIETLYPWEDRAVLICNDEGKLMGLPLNRSLEDYDIIAGTFFICGLGDEDFCSLTEAQMEHYKSKYRMGILFADETGDPNAIPIASIVQETNTAFGQAINEIVAAHPECDEVDIQYHYETGPVRRCAGRYAAGRRCGRGFPAMAAAGIHHDFLRVRGAGCDLWPASQGH